MGASRPVGPQTEVWKGRMLIRSLRGGYLRDKAGCLQTVSANGWPLCLAEEETAPNFFRFRLLSKILPNVLLCWRKKGRAAPNIGLLVVTAPGKTPCLTWKDTGRMGDVQLCLAAQQSRIEFFPGSRERSRERCFLVVVLLLCPVVSPSADEAWTVPSAKRERRRPSVSSVCGV